MPPPYPSSLVKNDRVSDSIFKRIYMTFRNMLSRFLRLIFVPKFNWWKPVRINRWLGINMDYSRWRFTRFDMHKAQDLIPSFVAGSVFRSLRFIPNGHEIPLKVQRPRARSETPSPYEFFYNLYKPSTPYKKTSPPLPDFAVAIVK
jgi:tRNA-splicing endonuclease subunit Sen54